MADLRVVGGERECEGHIEDVGKATGLIHAFGGNYTNRKGQPILGHQQNPVCGGRGNICVGQTPARMAAFE